MYVSNIDSDLYDNELYFLSITNAKGDTVCNPNPCENNGICVPSAGESSCSCQDGFSGAICQRGELSYFLLFHSLTRGPKSSCSILGGACSLCVPLTKKDKKCK